jgi:hypothetical protein
LTYANVMATVAFLVATSGTAYAATKINGHEIKTHTLPANRLVKGAVVPKATVATRLSHLLVTHGKTKAHKSHDSSTSSVPTSVVSLSNGQSSILFQNEALTITAHCTDTSSGEALVLDGSGTEPWYSADDPGTQVPAGTSVRLADQGGGTAPNFYVHSPSTGFDQTAAMFGVDGESLVLGEYTVTNNITADCTFSGTAID